MKTILKSFRIDKNLIHFLEQFAKKEGLSEASVIEIALKKIEKEQKQWENDLKIMKEDKEYCKEQEKLANEIYENI